MDKKLKMPEIVYVPNLTQDEAIKKAKELEGRILTNNELDSLLNQKILNPELFPVWSGTSITYEGSEGELAELDKTLKVTVPKEDGWYEKDVYGFPSGKPSNSEDPEARYLWRKTQYSGLLVRRYYGVVVYGRRVVYAYVWPYVRFGVFVIKR